MRIARNPREVQKNSFQAGPRKNQWLFFPKIMIESFLKWALSVLDITLIQTDPKTFGTGKEISE